MRALAYDVIDITIAVLPSTPFTPSGCAGFFDRYPNDKKPTDLVGAWMRAEGRLVVDADGSFEIPDMPSWVAARDSSNANSGDNHSSVWTLGVETRNVRISPFEAGCDGSGFATGKQDEPTIAFGIDNT